MFFVLAIRAQSVLNRSICPRATPMNNNNNNIHYHHVICIACYKLYIVRIAINTLFIVTRCWRFGTVRTNRALENTDLSIITTTKINCWDNYNSSVNILKLKMKRRSYTIFSIYIFHLSALGKKILTPILPNVRENCKF